MALMLLAGCANVDLAAYRTVDIRAPLEDSGGRAALDFQGVPLSSGQVIVSEVDSAVSLLLTLMTETYSPWIHAGVISIEDGRPWVYEAFGLLRPHLRGPPTDAMGGSVRRISFERYLKRQAVVAVFEPLPAVDRRAVARFARSAEHAGLPFDPGFDHRTRDAVYCTEFVARALEAGGAAPFPALPRNDNPSLGKALDWLGIDAPGFLAAARLVERASPVALLSEEYSPAQVAARFAVKRELHRRFTPDQRLGNVFRWIITGPDLRPQVEALIAAAIDEAQTGHLSAEAAARLYRRHLGPVAEPRLAAR